MSSKRLRKRVPSASVIETVCLRQYDLRFHKKSKDGSAKCDVVFTGRDEDYVLGVLYSIDAAEKINLDKAEGLGYGYEIKEVEVFSTEADEDAGSDTAFLYYATSIDETLQPYDWYKEHVLRGAEEARLPDYYIRKITAVKSQEDTDTERAARERSIHTD